MTTARQCQTTRLTAPVITCRLHQGQKRETSIRPHPAACQAAAAAVMAALQVCSQYKTQGGLQTDNGPLAFMDEGVASAGVFQDAADKVHICSSPPPSPSTLTPKHPTTHLPLPATPDARLAFRVKGDTTCSTGKRTKCTATCENDTPADGESD